MPQPKDGESEDDAQTKKQKEAGKAHKAALADKKEAEERATAGPKSVAEHTHQIPKH